MPVLPASGSLFVITPLSGASTPELAPYSARGLRQSLKQVGSGDRTVRETVDGVTVDLTPPWMKKYESTVTCSDIALPFIDNAFRGVICSVQCCCELAIPLGATPNRPVVSGSLRTDPEDDHLQYYRPELIMMVIDIDVSEFDEWAAAYTWQMKLREVQAA